MTKILTKYGLINSHSKILFDNHNTTHTKSLVFLFIFEIYERVREVSKAFIN